MRPDAEFLQSQVIVDQIVETGIGEGHVMQADFAAGPRGLALGRGFLGERTGVDERDPVMVVVIADKADEFVLVQYLGPENRAVPVAHRLAAVGLQYEVRQLAGFRHGHDALPDGSRKTGADLAAGLPGSIPADCTVFAPSPQPSPPT